MRVVRIAPHSDNTASLSVKPVPGVDIPWRHFIDVRHQFERRLALRLFRKTWVSNVWTVLDSERGKDDQEPRLAPRITGNDGCPRFAFDPHIYECEDGITLERKLKVENEG